MVFMNQLNPTGSMTACLEGIFPQQIAPIASNITTTIRRHMVQQLVNVLRTEHYCFLTSNPKKRHEGNSFSATTYKSVQSFS